ncbi:hypothetical protein ABIA99_007534 [Bradyrhizobium sp. LB12.1]|uniref:hypothetical protein n=1 Tax=Bradyrhizobium sp. LB12.1 TaxID=3156327 RepID=UPI0033980D45
MKILSSRLNANLANSLDGRISAELKYIAGQSFFRKSIGVGLAGLCGGLAVAAAFVGYSYVADSRTTADKIAAAISKSLSQVELRGQAVGNIDIHPSEIRLAPDQKVALSQDSRLKLDPSAKVKAEGSMRIQLPTISAMSAQSTPKIAPKAQPITNYTIFKSVPFQTGTVSTGWRFLTSTQKEPTSQYCYFTERGDSSDVSFKIDIGDDGIMTKDKVPPKFDLTSAFARCVWFRKDA